MFSVEILGKYAFRGSGADFFIGGGLTYISAKEKIDMTLSAYGETASASTEGSFSGFGPVFVFGVDFPINKDKTTVLYGELSGRSVKFDSEGVSSDLGGGALEVGVRFNTFKEK